VACQAGRSQHQNREEAWKMLRARLYELELQKREAAQQALEDQKTDIGWGHQIRSYVLQPYQMVKDLRTEVETSTPRASSTATSISSWARTGPAGRRHPGRAEA
jgi:peptide chain release factor 2